MDFLKVEKNDHIQIKDVLLCIDSPTLGLSQRRDVFIFSGWFLSFDKTKNLEIECVQGQARNKTAPSRVRKDVVGHYVSKGECDVNDTCGFLFELSGGATVNFIVDGVIYSSIDFSFEVHDCPPDLEAWKRMHVLNSTHTEAQAQVAAAKVVDYAYPWNKLATSMVQLEKNLENDLEARERIKEFISSSSNRGFLLDLVGSAVRQGRLRIKSIYSDGSAYCDESYYESPFNYLKFIDESTGELFYIAQHFSVFDALYAPKYGFIYAKPTTTPVRHAKDIIKACGRFSSMYSAGGFNGLACMHSRPYHFLYDISYGLWALYQAGILSQVERILLNETHAFYSVRNLFDLPAQEHIYPAEDFVIELNKPGFCIFPGFTDFDFKSDMVLKNYQDLDVLLVKKSCDSKNRASALRDQIGLMAPVFWFGITSQKRKLVNQVSEIGNTVNALSEKYPSAVFLIDGWTSPIKPGAGDLNEIASDESVFSEIRDLLIDPSRSFSIIGFTSEEKIAVGAHVDLYVTNNGTGSMHVDRVCGKHGLTHISNSWTAMMDLSIHRHSKRIDGKYINDLSDDQSKIDKIDYSLDSGAMLKEVVLFLDSSEAASLVVFNSIK